MRAVEQSAWRAERRAAARRHHPDLGGDTQEYLSVMAEIDRRHGAGAVRLLVADDHRSRAVRRLRATARRARAASRTARTRLPRWAPGARRYTQI